METGRFSSGQAAAALEAIEESRGKVRAETHTAVKLDPLIRVLTRLVVCGAKDLVPDRRARWAVTVGWRVACYGIVFLAFRRKRVIPAAGGPRKPSVRLFAWGVTATVALVVVQWLIVAGLRRSGLRRPNLVAGPVLALLDVGHHYVVRRLLRTRTELAADDASPAPELHESLRSPTTLSVCAVLSEGVVEDGLLGEWLALGADELAGQIQALTDQQLASRLTFHGKSLVLLTPSGHEVFAQHVRALHELSTGDTPR